MLVKDKEGSAMQTLSTDELIKIMSCTSSAKVVIVASVVRDSFENDLSRGMIRKYHPELKYHLNDDELNELRKYFDNDEKYLFYLSLI